VIVALPTDPAVLNHPEFKARGYAIGVGAIAVRIAFRLSVRTDYLILPTQNSQGTDAEYIAMPWAKIFPIPPESGIDTRAGAAGFVAATTVLTFMSEAYEVKKGDTILVHTVAGGFGLIAAQYAKYKGATVIGTTSTDAKAELAKKHGADHVILYTKEDTVKRVLEITNGVGVEAVFDGVGKDTYVFFPGVIL
jgi:NADPH2:quinone reductase